MKELMPLGVAEAMGALVDEIVKDHHGMSRSDARRLIANALTYNVVIEEIKGQINWLLDED